MTPEDAPGHTLAIVFLPLMIPFGVSSGFVIVTLAYLLAHHGIAAGPIAALAALTVWPQTWKMFWAPVVDTTLTPKWWSAIGTAAVALSLIGLSIVPPVVGNMAWLGVLVVVSSVASSVSAMAAEAMMSIAIEDNRRGAVSGWSQAGNLGGSGLGGGLALWLSQHVALDWLPGVGAGLLCLVCLAVLPLVRMTPHHAERPHVFRSLLGVGRDLWSLARSRVGLLAIVIMVLPIGSGAASNIWAAISEDWRAGADLVALANGVLGGVASLIGALIGGWVCDKLDRRTAYCLFGLVLAAVSAAMAVMPRTPGVFVGATLAYALVCGACYAAYSAVVLESIGPGAPATKFSLLSAISNIPIAAMTDFDGYMHDRVGSGGMLIAETLAGIGAVMFFILFVDLTRSRRRPRGYRLWIDKTT